MTSQIHTHLAATTSADLASRPHRERPLRAGRTWRWTLTRPSYIATARRISSKEV